MTLLEIQERLIGNWGERFSSSVLWRFFDLWRAWRVISLLQRIRPRRRLLPAKMEIRALQSS